MNKKQSQLLTLILEYLTDLNGSEPQILNVSEADDHTQIVIEIKMKK